MFKGGTGLYIFQLDTTWDKENDDGENWEGYEFVTEQLNMAIWAADANEAWEKAYNKLTTHVKHHFNEEDFKRILTEFTQDYPVDRILPSASGVWWDFSGVLSS